MIEQLNQIKLEIASHENLKYITCVLEALIIVINENKAENDHTINSHLSAVRHCMRLYLGKCQWSESLNKFLTHTSGSLGNTNKVDKPSGSAIQSPNDSPSLEKRMVEEQAYLETLTTQNNEVAIKLFLFECWASLIKQKKPSKKFFLSYAWPKPHEDPNNESWITPYLAKLAEHLILCGMQVYIDQFHSGPGKSLGGFMGKINEIVLSCSEHGESIVREIDHVFIVSSRTLPVKLSIPQSGCSYEQEQLRERITAERSHLFIIPLLLNLKNYLPPNLQNLVGINFCSEPYLANITELSRIVYKLGHDYTDFCHNKIKKYGLGLDVYIAKGLREQYMSHAAANIHYLFYQQSVPVKDCFISLAVISEDEKKAKESQLQLTRSEGFRDDRVTAIEGILKPKEIIELDKLWNLQSNNVEKYSHVLVEGLAGVGKTTLIQYLANQWALSPQEKKITWLNQFDAVIVLPLRKLHAYSKVTDLSTFIYDECISAQYKQLLSPDMVDKYLLNNNKIRTLYLLDGVDEVWSLFNNASIHYKLLTSLFGKESWLATTRPGSLHAELLGQFRHLENIGFIDENINKYVRQFFRNRKTLTEDEQINKTKLISHLIETDYTIKNIARIPIYLEFICSIVSEKVQGLKQDLSNVTITILYYKMLSLLLRRYLMRLQALGLLTTPSNTTNIDVLDLDDDEIFSHEKCQAPLAFMCELSWQMMQDTSFIITTDVIRPIFKNYFPNKDKKIIDELFKHLFILKPIGETMRSALDQSYYFIHFSFQEFLAAFYTANAMQLDDKKIIIKHINVTDTKKHIVQNRYHPKYESVWWFTAGLLEGDELLDKYFQMMDEDNKGQEDTKDVIGLARTLLKMHCLNETRSKMAYSLEEGSLVKPISRAKIILQEIIEWMKSAQWQGEKLNGITKQFMDHLLTCARIFQCTVIANSLIEFLNSIRDKNQIFFQVPVILAILVKRANQDQTIILFIKELTQAKNESLRMEAVRALGQIDNVDNSLVEYIINYSLLENFENHHPNVTLDTLRWFALKQPDLVFDGLFRRIYTHKELHIKIRLMRMIASIEAASDNVDQKLEVSYKHEEGEYKTNIAYALIMRKKGIIDEQYIHNALAGLDNFDSYQYLLPGLVTALSPYHLQIILHYLTLFIKNPNQIIQRVALIQMMEVINENEALAQTVLWPLLEETKGFHLLKVFVKRLDVLIIFSTQIIKLYIKCCNVIGLAPTRTRYSEQELQNLFLDLTLLTNICKELLVKIKQYFYAHHESLFEQWPLGLALILLGHIDQTVAETLKKICKDNSIPEIIKSHIYDSIITYILNNKDKLLSPLEANMLKDILESINVAVSPVKKCIARNILGLTTERQTISELISIIRSQPPAIDIDAFAINDFRFAAVQALLDLSSENVPHVLNVFDVHEDLKWQMVFRLSQFNLSGYLLQLPTSLKQQTYILMLLSCTPLSHIIKTCIATSDTAFLPVIIARVINDRISIYLQNNQLYWYDVDTKAVVSIDVTSHQQVVKKIIHEIEKSLKVPQLEQSAYEAFSKGEFNIAIQHYKSVLDYMPDHKTAHQNLGCCYHLMAMQNSDTKDSDLKEAEKSFLSAIDINPNSANRTEYANFLFMQNRYHDAIRQLNQVINSELQNDPDLLSYGNSEQLAVPEQIRSMIRRNQGQITLGPIQFAYFLMILSHRKINSSSENILEFLPRFHSLVRYTDAMDVSLFAASCEAMDLTVLARYYVSKIDQICNPDIGLIDLRSQALDNYTRKNLIIANKLFDKLCEQYTQEPEIVIYAARCKCILALHENSNQKLFLEAENLFKCAMQLGISVGFIEYATFLYLRRRYREAQDYVTHVCYSRLLDGNMLSYHFVEKDFVISELRKAYPPERDLFGTFGFPGFHRGNSVIVHDYVYAYALAIKIAHCLNRRQQASSFIITLTSLLKDNRSQVYGDMLLSLQDSHVKFLQSNSITTTESAAFTTDVNNTSEFAPAPTRVSSDVANTSSSIFPSLLHLSLFAVANSVKQNRLSHLGNPVEYNPEAGNVRYAGTEKELLGKDIAATLKALVRK